jgi:hypothetical protein
MITLHKIKATHRRYIGLLFFLLLFCTLEVSAQGHCGTNESYQEMMKNDPDFRKKQEQSKKRSSSTSPLEGLATIPVVFHVVYNNEEENVSDEQLLSQIDVLNEDFQLLNTNIDTFWSDVIDNPEMEFCLATRDQYGNATCGITRTYTDSTVFKIKTSIKNDTTGGICNWPATEYCNIWIGDMHNLAGYATFPNADDLMDGIVIDYEYVGRGPQFDLPQGYDLGRTGTHEVGHWLSLFHIWGDGPCSNDDDLSDTPASDAPNYGCALGHTSCRSTDMVQNYMDYSDDACKYLFTEDQVTRMRLNFDTLGSRVSILSSKGCGIPGENELFFELHFDAYPQDISWELQDSLNNIIDSDGNFDPGDESQNIPPPLANSSKFYEFDLPDGTYTLTFFDSFGDGFPDGFYEIISIYDEVVISGQGVFDNELSITFNVENAEFHFLGTESTDWYDPNNWNKLAFPDACYDGDIIIEANCDVDKLTIEQQQNLYITNNAMLTILE